jgi:hypothetical protein
MNKIAIATARHDAPLATKLAVTVNVTVTVTMTVTVTVTTMATVTGCYNLTSHRSQIQSRSV